MRCAVRNTGSTAAATAPDPVRTMTTWSGRLSSRCAGAGRPSAKRDSQIVEVAASRNAGREPAANCGPSLLQPDFTWAGEGSVVFAAFLLSTASIYGKRLARRRDAVLMTGWQMPVGGWIAGGQIAALTPISTALLVSMALLLVCGGIWPVTAEQHAAGPAAASAPSALAA